MKKLNRVNTGLEKKLPIKVVQFGEGNFLRAFVEYAFQKLNKELDFNDMRSWAIKVAAKMLRITFA